MKKTKKAPSLPIPKIDSRDTISALMATIPEETLAKFPETTKFLLGQSFKQQDRMIRLDAHLRYKQVLHQIIQTVDPSSVASIDAGAKIIKKDMDSGVMELSEQNIEKLKVAASAFERENFQSDANTAQVPLPDIAGLSELVEFFKKEALDRIVDIKSSLPAPESDNFVPSLFKFTRYANTFISLHTWQNGFGIDNLFPGLGAANQATNVLRSLVADIDSTYPVNIGMKDLVGVVDKIKAEEIKMKARHAVARLSPEETLQAVELLRTKETEKASRSRNPGA